MNSKQAKRQRYLARRAERRKVAQIIGDSCYNCGGYGQIFNYGMSETEFSPCVQCDGTGRVVRVHAKGEPAV